MVSISAGARAVRAMLRHPLGRVSRRKTLARFVRWQVGSRLLGNAAVMPFVADAQLLVRTGMQGATGNLYVGLLELEPMGFVLHVLKRDELLLDVGANVGVYSILAAGGGARPTSSPSSRSRAPPTASRRTSGSTTWASASRCGAARSGASPEPSRCPRTATRPTVCSRVTGWLKGRVGVRKRASRWSASTTSNSQAAHGAVMSPASS